MYALSKFINRRLKELGIIVPQQLRDAVIRELSYAIEPPLHEGALPSFGAIITASRKPLVDMVEEAYRGRECRLDTDDVMRRAADGVRCFYCHYVVDGRTVRCSLWISDVTAFASEVALFSLRDEAVFKSTGHPPHRPNPPNDVMVVQRNSSGEVRLLSCSGILSISQGQWRRRDYQYSLKLEEFCTASEKIDADKKIKLEKVYRSMARLAVHILGAQKIGATLIVENDPGELSRSDERIIESERSLDVSKVALEITKKTDQTIIAHLLAHNDGAAIFSSDGLLLSVKNWLTAKPSLEDSIQNPGGTRQLSAMCASRHMTLPVITVSSDGPVRAFFQGVLVRG
jgi:hypothetical protein